MSAPEHSAPPGGPLVGIVMGSRSDWDTMQHAAAKLDALGVPHEVRVVSAHRTPDALFAAAMLAHDDTDIAAALAAFREKQTDDVAANDDPRQ
jgi:phosphoribosylcarboxyaminoimidazole (NCAIR) mutase